MGGGGSKDQEKVGAIWSEKLGTLQPLKVSPHDWKVALSNSKFERTVKMPDGVYQTEHFEPVKSLLRPEREPPAQLAEITWEGEPPDEDGEDASG